MSSISTAFHVTRSGLQLQEINLALKAQNLAAQGADGYKKQYLVSYDLPYQDIGSLGASTSNAGTISPTGLQIGLGVQAGGIYRVFTPGDPIQTNEPLDLMISGDGFFEVTMPDGTTAYTRVGSLQKDPTGKLVMPKTGYPVKPDINIPADATAVQVNSVGQVYATVGGVDQLLGQFSLASFVNPSGLKSMGDSMFVATTASGTANIGTPGTYQFGSIRSGWRESSNVNAVEEITDLIKLEKVYDMLTKVLKTGDAMLEATNRVGR